jgi:hypothetical protein
MSGTVYVYTAVLITRPSVQHAACRDSAADDFPPHHPPHLLIYISAAANKS